MGGTNKKAQDRPGSTGPDGARVVSPPSSGEQGDPSTAAERQAAHPTKPPRPKQTLYEKLTGIARPKKFQNRYIYYIVITKLTSPQIEINSIWNNRKSAEFRFERLVDGYNHLSSAIQLGVGVDVTLYKGILNADNINPVQIRQIQI